MKNKRDAVIVHALRIDGEEKGSFADTRPDELVSQLLQSLVQQTRIAPDATRALKSAVSHDRRARREHRPTDVPFGRASAGSRCCEHQPPMRIQFGDSFSQNRPYN